MIHLYYTESLVSRNYIFLMSNKTKLLLALCRDSDWVPCAHEGCVPEIQTEDGMFVPMSSNSLLDVL